MSVVRAAEYERDKREFFTKHHNDFQCESKGTSAEFYDKLYTFVDGAVWHEVMMKVDVEVETEIYFVKLKVPVELFQVEYYNSDTSENKFYYEKWDHTK